MNLFKIIIGSSLLIAALSVAYYFVIFLPTQHTKLTINMPTPTALLEESSTLHLLNLCLKIASDDKEDAVGRIVAFAKENNQNGEHDLSGAFDSIDVEYERDRQDCFAKFPQ